MTSPRKLAAGNWKMNGTAAALAEVEALIAHLPETGCDVLLCPPATLIAPMTRVAAGRFAVGGQDCHAKASGAHTGDISAAMLADAGAAYVILGHSERRADHGESDADVAAKTAAAWAAGLTPIVCLGETLDQREAGETLAVVGGQLAGSVPADAVGKPLVIAYEPVWAIGTGRTPTIDDIAQMHAHMRQLLVARFGKTGEAALLLYGGSVKPSNAEEILRTPNVNGALVGGASLLADDFFSIIVAA